MGQTALVIVVPEAETVVGALRLHHDPAARLGVPAHVTILYPFRAEVDDVTTSQLDHLASSMSAFDARFDSVGRFPGDVVFLVPTPRESFKRMITEAMSTFPDCPPYEGTIPDPEPHLTIGDGVDPPTADDIERVVAPGLPIRMRVDRLTMLAQDQRGHWIIGRSWPLGHQQR